VWSDRGPPPGQRGDRQVGPSARGGSGRGRPMAGVRAPAADAGQRCQFDRAGDPDDQALRLGGRKAEFDAAVDRARRWLWTVKAETTGDAAYQLLGLHWAGEPADKLADLAKALLSQQRKDGGWAQLPKLESDAYATGQALYALSRAVKHPTTSRDWQHGLRFLL